VVVGALDCLVWRCIRRQKQPGEAIEWSSQQRIGNERQKRRGEQQFQWVYETNFDDLINAVERNRDKERGSRSSPALMKQLKAARWIRQHRPKISLLSLSGVRNAGAQGEQRRHRRLKDEPEADWPLRRARKLSQPRSIMSKIVLMPRRRSEQSERSRFNRRRRGDGSVGAPTRCARAGFPFLPDNRPNGASASGAGCVKTLRGSAAVPNFEAYRLAYQNDRAKFSQSAAALA
jgi:hypothetical protein